MRLWHQSLIPLLDRQRLLGAHRELCALRGKGWGRKHATVDYVFTHEPERLVAYHYLVMDEMQRRGYKPDPIWYRPNWRGSALGECDGWAHFRLVESFLSKSEAGIHIYHEHDAAYYEECVENLRQKGIEI